MISTCHHHVRDEDDPAVSLCAWATNRPGHALTMPTWAQEDAVNGRVIDPERHCRACPAYALHHNLRMFLAPLPPLCRTIFHAAREGGDDGGVLPESVMGYMLALDVLNAKLRAVALCVTLRDGRFFLERPE